jgi:hypothetical protein
MRPQTVALPKGPPDTFFAYNRAHRALVVFAPDGRPMGMLPIEMLNELLAGMGWPPCVPSDLRASLPEFPPAIMDKDAARAFAGSPALAPQGPSSPLR